MNGGSSSSTTPNFDNLLLQSLISGHYLNSPNKSLQQLFSDLLLNPSESDSNSDDEENYSKTNLAREESRLEKEIVRTILSGEIEKLKPNSGQAVTIGEHHICVGFHEAIGSDYRVWEWHGHIMLIDEENGYTMEYIYGNYLERKREMKTKKNNENVKEGNVGLKELFGCGEKGSGNILHRNFKC
ncbi:hypothetical protein ACJIZ3_024159 [Penstemon smallii]|uniref:Uncharacterized protein n=1 Tax=Penstemon smallii TaxID=265156 RepID=A0ABD3TU57_9LAMI